MLRISKRIAVLGALSLVLGCAAPPPMKTVDYVDLEKFMGDWYVIANIPTYLEQNAHNSVESCFLNKDGGIDATFTFREGGFDGPLKTFRPKGFIKDRQSNALWGMEFVWPFKSDYRIVYLSEDYDQVIIARRARDYVWVMARTPEIPSEDYKLLTERVKNLGYNIEKLVRVPQHWPQLAG